MQKNISFLSIISLIIFISSCANKSAPIIPAELDGFEILEIPGTDYYEAISTQGDNTLEHGVIQNGAKQGTWITFHKGRTFPETIANYVNGSLNGPFFKFNNRGQMTLRASCLNGNFEGKYEEYENGRIRKEKTILGGQIEGLAIDYYNNGKKRNELNYKAGKLHGKSTYYNEQEEVVQEYNYENGQVVE